MANHTHLAKLRKGVITWNRWRSQNRKIQPDLRGADLRGAHLSAVDLIGADLTAANLESADLSFAFLSGKKTNLSRARLTHANLNSARAQGTNFSGARLARARFEEADLSEANLNRANLVGANLFMANLTETKLHEVDLSEAYVVGANFMRADLRDSILRQAFFNLARFEGADLRNTNLSEADLRGASLVRTNLEGANLTASKVYGISAWDVNLEGAIQSNHVITPSDESVIQVDNLEVAQFIYLLLNNRKIRETIDSITSKVVLILGRFTPKRKAVLTAIRDELRRRDYLPVLFDFEKPISKDLTGTISTLANMARFIIADLTNPSSVPHELATVVPGTAVPVQTIILEGQKEYAMFRDLMRRHHWVLEPYRYKSKKLLISHLRDRVIAPAEAKVRVLAEFLPRC